MKQRREADGGPALLLLTSTPMLVRRCAWHRSYRGYPLALGVASWRGFRLAFTDGMCVSCAARLRREWNLPPATPSALMLIPGGGFIRVATTAAMILAVILAARPVDEARVSRASVTVPLAERLVAAPAYAGDAAVASTAPVKVTRASSRPGAVASSTIAPAPVAPVVVAAVSPASKATPSFQPAMRPTAAPRVFPDIGVAFQTMRGAVALPSIANVPFAAAAPPHAGLTQQTP